jgi:hypothetical protein
MKSVTLHHAGISSLVYGLAVIISLGLLVSFSATPVLAQSATGTLDGQITDQQGAVIANAEVKLIDTGTSSVRTTTTNEVGRYTFVNVQPGTYDVTVTKTGFTAAKLSAQKIDIGSSLTLNVTLQVGATTTTVEVQAAAGAELQTLNATVGETITNQSLNLLPNLGRDASTLSVLQVGVSLAGNVAGAVTDQNQFSLDGVNNSDDMAGTNSTYTVSNAYGGSSSSGGTPTGVMPTPIESIEEFKVGTTGQTAEFNAAAGSQVQMVTKRGTNALHGSVYEFYFGSSVGAANIWQSNRVGIPLPDTHRNRFGAALGGPLTPKFWGGKTYFFVNYEGMRYPNGQLFQKGSPTQLMRAGVIQMNNSAGVLTAYNLNPMPVTVNGTTYQPAQCVIGGASGPCDPRGLGVNPLVQKIWNNLPLPNDSSFTAGSATTGLVDGINTQGYDSNLPLPQRSNFIVGRLDHDFGEKWKFMSSYRYYTFIPVFPNQVDVGGLLGGSLGSPVAPTLRPVKPSFWAAGLTTTITANITNDFRVGYLRNYWQWFSAAAPPQLPGLGAAVEIGGESLAGSLIPYNVDSQDVRQRYWNGHDWNFNDSVSQLHGNHLIQYGGTYLRNFDVHQRNDNGVGIFSGPVYQVGATNTNSANYVLPTGAAGSNLSNYVMMFNELTGIVTQSQVMYTRTGQNLTLNPAFNTSGFDQSIVPTYELYGSDTWHLRPSLTLTYGLSWGVSMPPYELNGKQVMPVNGNTNQVFDIQSYLNARQAAALAGQVYQPQLAFADINNLPGGGRKYPFDPYYGGFSPRVSLAWAPNKSSGWLGSLLGSNKTVIRGGYARIYGRLNGVNLLLVPLLAPGPLQAVSCTVPTMAGQCGLLTSGPANGFRIGTDGLSAPLPGQGALASQVSPTLPQPYLPGATQNGFQNATAADGSVLDPKLRPNHSDEANFSIQRSLNSKMILEVGYIGRRIKNEFSEINLDAVPYMTTLGGQSYAQAFAKVYQQLCGGLVTVCSPNQAAVTAQPFFEAAMGGASSAYCAGSTSCTAAVAKNEAANFQNGRGFNVWNDLASKAGWTLGRSLLITPSTGGSSASPQQLTGGIDFINSLGSGNYNAGFVAFTARDWHGLTARSNFTWGRALGTAAQTQSSSTITVPDPFNSSTFGTYGPQSYDVKYTYSLLMLYQPQVFKGQKGFLGHVLGGWAIAPLFTARSGLPLGVTDLASNGGAFGAVYSGQSATYERAVLNAPYTGGSSGSASYNVPLVTGSGNPNGVATTGGKTPTGVNLFPDPIAAYSEFRTPVLGVDTNTALGYARGFPFWNLDATLSKEFQATERIGATLTIQFVNIFNHFTPSDPTLSLATPSTFGVVTGQYTQPNGAQARWMEFGLRVHF